MAARLAVYAVIHASRNSLRFSKVVAMLFDINAALRDYQTSPVSSVDGKASTAACAKPETAMSPPQ